jgi:hypothetical protein
MVDCKKCPEHDKLPCYPEGMGNCGICGNSVLSPCDEYFVNEEGQICHEGCRGHEYDLCRGNPT